MVPKVMARVRNMLRGKILYSAAARTADIRLSAAVNFNILGMEPLYHLHKVYGVLIPFLAVEMGVHTVVYSAQL